MNASLTRGIIKSQSSEGRKVSYLISYVHDHGPQTQTVLVGLAKAHKPLRLAVEFDYLVLTAEGKYSLGQEAGRVITWILGKTAKPPQWDSLESKAEQVKRVARRIITKDRKV